MLKIKRLELVDYCQHSDRVIDFSSGVTGIIGSNGKGKSNIINGLRFALRGQSRTAGKKVDDLRWGAKGAGSVVLEFELNGTNIKVERSIKISKAKLRIGGVGDIGGRLVEGTKEVNATLEELLGIDGKMIDNTIFVEQGKMEDILFEEPAKRAAGFQSLFKTAYAETLRDRLQTIINDSTVIDYTEEIDRLKSKLKSTIKPQLAEAQEALKKAEAREVKVDHNALQDLIVAYEVWCRKAQQNKDIQERLSQYRATELKLKEELERLQPQCDAWAKTVTALDAEIERGQVELATAEAANLRARDCDSRMAELANIRAELKKYKSSAPAKPALTQQQIDEVQHQANTLQMAVMAAEQFIAAFDETGKCSQCGAAADKEQVEGKRKFVAENKPSLDEQLELLRFSKGALANYVRQEQQYTTTVAALESQEKQAAAAVEAFGDVPRYTQDALRQLGITLADKAKERGELSKKLRDVEELEGKYASTQQTADQLEKSIEADIVAPCTEDDYSQAKQTIAEATAVNEAITAARGKVDGLEIQREEAEGELAHFQRKEESARNISHFKSLCVKARQVLHRDELPHIVGVKYLTAINQKLSYYLQQLAVGFTAKVLDSYAVECIFSNGKSVPADRLSGGQKVMLSIAFRFAVSELFASELGLLVLDEPTVYLDGDNVDTLARVFEHARTIVGNMGNQLVVVTHEEALMPICDVVVQL